ncbi:MAG: histidine phosphatase family protein [Actinomycetota bacterium]
MTPNTTEAAQARMLIVRHGQSIWNLHGRWQGQADPPLSPEGEHQALDAANCLFGTGIHRIFASDLQRARRTAEILAEHLGVATVTTDAGLRELDVGKWTGLTRDEIEHRWPGMLAARAQNRLLTPPGGETPRNLATRVSRAVNEIAATILRETNANRTGEPLVAVLISHRGPISTLERSMGLQPTRAGHLAGHWFEVDARLQIRHIAAANLLQGPAYDDSPETL